MRKTSDNGHPRIIIEGVRKTYRLRHTHSFKETFVAWIRRKQTASSFQALEGIDITVGEGESVALLGYNGSGKSTLLKLVSGVLQPDAGTVLTRGRVAGLIEVGAGFHPDLSGRENVYLNAAILGMSKDEIDAKFDEIVEFSEIGEFIDTEVKHYSSGMFVRLAFSVAINTSFDILLVDEVLAVGDAPFREKCKAKIRELVERDKTLFIVSHDLGMISELCVRGIVIQRGRTLFDGPVDEAIATLKSSKR